MRKGHTGAETPVVGGARWAGAGGHGPWQEGVDGQCGGWAVSLMPGHPMEKGDAPGEACWVPGRRPELPCRSRSSQDQQWRLGRVALPRPLWSKAGEGPAAPAHSTARGPPVAAPQGSHTALHLPPRDLAPCPHHGVLAVAGPAAGSQARGRSPGSFGGCLKKTWLRAGRQRSSRASAAHPTAAPAALSPVSTWYQRVCPSPLPGFWGSASFLGAWRSCALGATP